MSKLTIGITGATGFVGNALCERFISQGHEVIQFNRQQSNDSVFFDMSNPVQPLEELESCKVLIHCAAQIDQQLLTEEELLRINAEGTKYIFEKSKKYGVEKFINISSGAVYGSNHIESCTENTMCKPDTPYGKSKWLAERYCVSDESIKVANLRLYFPFGANQKNRFIPNLIENIKCNRPILLNQKGMPKVNPIHIDSLLNYIGWFVENKSYGNFNVAGNEVVTIEQLVIMIAGILNKDLNELSVINTDKSVGNMIGDIHKLRKTTNILENETLVDGLRKTIL